MVILNGPHLSTMVMDFRSLVALAPLQGICTAVKANTKTVMQSEVRRDLELLIAIKTLIKSNTPQRGTGLEAPVSLATATVAVLQEVIMTATLQGQGLHPSLMPTTTTVTNIMTIPTTPSIHKLKGGPQ